MPVRASIEFAAMAAIVDVLDGLDSGARTRVLRGVDAWYANPLFADDGLSTSTDPSETQSSRSVGRPYSPATRRIIQSLRDRSPATPAAISKRTGLDRNLAKSTLHRLAKSGVVVREARGLYRLATPAIDPSS
jgi:hypothetical protein